MSITGTNGLATANAGLKVLSASLIAGQTTSVLNEQQRKELARLRAVHELYTEYEPQWKLQLAAYEGGIGFANRDNLNRYPREHEDDYIARTKRLHYVNYCAPLVDFFTGFIFAETISRDGGGQEDFFTKFTKNVNHKNEDIEAFMKQVCDDMQIFGMSYVLVDAPEKSSSVVSVADEQAQGIDPYWVLIRPTEILDWVTDSFDNLLYVKRQHFVTEMVGLEGRKNLERYTEWTPTQIKITDVDVTKASDPKISVAKKIKNELGEIPIEVVRYKRSKMNRFMGESFLIDFAHNNREVMNLTSLVQEFLYKQCFNILAMEGDPNLPLYEQHDGEIGLSNLFLYPRGSKPPHYITPADGPAKAIAEERSWIVAEMFRRAAQDTLNELFNGHKSSGYSKSQSFKTTVPQIASRADSLEKLEMRLMARTFKYKSLDWDGTIKYKDHYEITNITDALAQLGTLFKDLQFPSPTFVKTEMKRMVHEFDGKISPEDMASIDKEIDSMDFEEWSATQKLAYIGRAALSPDASLAVDGTRPVKGKDTSTKPSTPQRSQSSSAEIKAESSKTPTGN